MVKYCEIYVCRGELGYEVKMKPLEIIANIIGVIAVATFVFSYQLKTRKAIIICNAASRVLFVAQYFLLGAFEGAMLDVVSIAAVVLAEKRDTPFIKKHLKAAIILVNLAMIATGIIFYKNIFSLLPLIGVLLQTGAFWLTKEKDIRLVSVLGSPFWFTYNVYSHAYGSSLGDVMTFVSIITAMIRYKDWKKKSE